jgi:hypothetical protein
MVSNEKGFLFIDVVVALTIFTVAVAALGTCFVTLVHATKDSENVLIAIFFAQQKLEQMKSATLSAESVESDEMLALDQQIFVRNTKVFVHPTYPSLLRVIVTVALPGSPSRPSVTCFTDVLNKTSDLHP